MSAIHAIPMNEEELEITSRALYTRKIRLESYVKGMHKDVEELPNMRLELDMINQLWPRIVERIHKIEESKK